MEVPNIQNRNIAGADPVLVADIVNHIKSKGIFDEMRKECLADVDTKVSNKLVVRQRTFPANEKNRFVII